MSLECLIKIRFLSLQPCGLIWFNGLRNGNRVATWCARGSSEKSAEIYGNLNILWQRMCFSSWQYWFQIAAIKLLWKLIPPKPAAYLGVGSKLSLSGVHLSRIRLKPFTCDRNMDLNWFAAKVFHLFSREKNEKGELLSERLGKLDSLGLATLFSIRLRILNAE